VEEAISMLS